jgi:hypothetical protein
MQPEYQDYAGLAIGWYAASESTIVARLLAGRGMRASAYAVE